MDRFFAYAKPEEVGIRSEHVQDFIVKLDAYDLCMHSVLLIRRGKLVAQAYYAPFTAKTLHRMFSVTKSFTSLAIGLLQEEGKLSLDHQIADYFPEKLPNQGLHPYLRETTIRDMLIMASPHATTTYQRRPVEDWVQSFFAVEPTHPPGTIFSYDTSSSHTLAALVEKLAGMPLLDYLRKRFLDQIGFSKEAYILTDPMGVSMGGSGLMATPLDVAKVAWLVLRGGAYRGLRYLPQDYIKDAVSKQIDSSLREERMDGRQGYGYQFWRVRHNGFAMLGMGGQYALCFPDQDLLLVTTGDIQGVPFGRTAVFDAFFDEILANLEDRPLEPNQGAWERLDTALKGAAMKPLRGPENAALAAQINGKIYRVSPNKLGIEQVFLSFEADKGTLHYTDQQGSHQLDFGLNAHLISTFPHYNLQCATSAAWLDRNNLLLRSCLIDYEIGMMTIQLCFDHDRATVLLKRNVEIGGTSLLRDTLVFNLLQEEQS